MNKHAWYLAGPMTGIPHFNFPLFIRVAAELRSAHDLVVISPAELDDEATARAAMASPDGDPSTRLPNRETWGDFLSRDVKLIADSVGGVILLDGWQKSRGARLEAFVGLLCGHAPGSGIEALSKQTVLTQLVRTTHAEINNAAD